MSTEQEGQTGGVNIGDVSGSIYNSMFAGRDIKDATITVGGQPMSADKEPTVAELQQLLTELQQELAEFAAQQAMLKEISSAAPLTAQAAEQSVNDAAAAVEPDLPEDDAKSVQQRIDESVSLLTTILNGAKTLAEKTGEAAKAVEPLIVKLTPLLERLGIAALWVGKLYLSTPG